jgi:outer membrane protein assembly factor BamA
MHKGRAYAGGIFKLDVDSRDNEIIPERGFLMNFNVRPLLGLTNHSNNLVQAEIDMRLFASIFAFRKLVVATRLGYGRNFGKFEFPQAYYLGGTENLRGYRRDRFGGRSAVFNNTEIRYKVADFNTYLFPGSFGLLLFNDVGRVKMDGEKSTDWHVGNGGGIWIAPVKRFVVTALATRSKEEKLLPYVTFGFQF